MIDAKRNPDWYRVKHNIAALHANWATDEKEKTTPAERAEHQDIARTESRELAQKAVEQLTYRWPPRIDADLRELLETSILPTALLLYAATSANRAETGRQTAPKDRRELLSRLKSNRLTAKAAMAYVDAKPDPSWLVLFAFACAHAQRNEFDRSIARLQEALRRFPNERTRAQIAQSVLADPSFGLLLKQKDIPTKQLRKELDAAAGVTGKPAKNAPKPPKKK